MTRTAGDGIKNRGIGQAYRSSYWTNAQNHLALDVLTMCIEYVSAEPIQGHARIFDQTGILSFLSDTAISCLEVEGDIFIASFDVTVSEHERKICSQ